MNDKELLELAAKAVGIEGDYINSCIRVYEAPHHSPELDVFWNPLTDDGDALRLAVNLEICIQHSVNLEMQECIEVFDSNSRFDGWFEELKSSDPYAATRRAIVRAAAEIGRNMP